MGLLDNFERGLERAVNGAFAKTFKSGLQPVEITSALRRELDTQAAVVSRERILVPNNFTVRLSQTDHQRMSGLGSTLISELTELVQRHATAQHYSFSGGIAITLSADDSLSQGMIEVDSISVKGTVAWTPVLEINGTRHPLTHSRTIIGRGSEADITVDDNGISRKHVEILWDGARAEVNDLNSTNGSKLNGSPVSRAPLAPESVIDIGRTRIVFRVLAQSADVDQPTDRHNDRGFTL
ncbi:MAG: FhaA domain-containing protein [Rhodoglobus sp.]